MVLKIEFYEKTFDKCPYSTDVYCEVYDKWVKCAMDRAALCHNCPTFSLKE
jgi:hypothetical protein